MQPDSPSISVDKAALREMLLTLSVRFGGPFTLASGETSDVYVDCRPATCAARAMPLIGRLFLDVMSAKGWQPEAVGGLMVGAEPIAFAVAHASLSSGPAIDAFIVRKEPKQHGMKKLVEGIEPTEGRKVVIVEDVCSKGGSTATAIKNVRSVGMDVLGAVCLVDREMGAGALLAGEGVELASVFTLSELRKFHEEQTAKGR